MKLLKQQSSESYRARPGSGERESLAMLATSERGLKMQINTYIITIGSRRENRRGQGGWSKGELIVRKAFPRSNNFH